MTEAAPTGAPQAAATPPPPPGRAFPSLKPVSAGSPVVETWGGYGAPCPKCGFVFVRASPEAVADALQHPDEHHGRLYCDERAAGLPERERERLRQLHGATGGDAPAAGPKATTRNARAAAKPPREKGAGASRRAAAQGAGP